MRNHARVVPILAVCLVTALLVRTAAAAPTQNFGPASGTMPDASTAQAKEQPQSSVPAKTATTDVVVAPKKATAPASDTAELKKLRSELEATRAELAQAKKTAGRLANLEKQNGELSAKLAATEKKLSAKPAVTADSGAVKQLRADLEKARGETAQARTEAAEFKKQAAAKPAVDNTEALKLRADLDKARTETAQARNETSELRKQLAAKPAADPAEIKKLRADLDKARAETAQARGESTELKKQMAAKPAVDPAEVKHLRAQLNQAQQEVEQAKAKSSGRISELEKQNAELSSKLNNAQKLAAAAPAEPPDVRIMKRLRDENSYLRNLLDTYAAKNPELKGQMRHYEQSAKE